MSEDNTNNANLDPSHELLLSPSDNPKAVLVCESIAERPQLWPLETIHGDSSHR